MKKFWEDIFRLSSAVAFSNITAFLAIPLLTRIYDPTAWGQAGIIFSISAVLAVISTARLEFAIPLCKTKIEANFLIFLCLALTAISLSVFSIIFLVANQTVKKFLGANFEALSVAGIVFVAFSIAFLSILTNAGSRWEKFSSLSISISLQQLANLTFSFLLSLVSPNSYSLIVSKFTGNLVGAIYLLKTLNSELKICLSSISLRKSVYLARTYFRFPLYSLPYSLIVVSSKELIVLALSFTTNPGVVGHYILARMVAFAPAGLLSSALGPIFYKNFINNFNQKNKNTLALKLMAFIILISAPFYVTAYLFSDYWFTHLFGKSWDTASMIFVMLLPASFLLNLTAWSDRIFEARQKQIIPLTVELISGLVLISFLSLSIVYGLGIDAILTYLAAILFFQQAIFLFNATRQLLKVND